MKVLVVGVFLDGTGWAHSAIDYALALDSVGVDVVCRHVKLNNANGEVPERIKQLLQKDSENCDAIIQHLLPPQYEYNAGCGVNIGLYCTEFDQFNYCDWSSYINLLDEAWVFNHQSKQASKKSNVTIPIEVVPPPANIDKFCQTYPPLALPELQSNSFKFYTIGEFVRRKNFAALVKAFHLEFSPDENVDLVIKTGLPGMTNPSQRVRQFCNEIKNSIRLYPKIEDYKQEIIITDRLSEAQLCSLHGTCNVFVSPSYGEAWGIPAFDALGFGKTPIVSWNAGYLEYVDHQNGWLVAGRIEPVFGMNDVSPHAYATGRDNWFSIDPLELQKSMREAFDNAYLRNNKSELGFERVEEFSYQVIGERMRSHIEKAISRKGN